MEEQVEEIVKAGQERDDFADQSAEQGVDYYFIARLAMFGLFMRYLSRLQEDEDGNVAYSVPNILAAYAFSRAINRALPEFVAGYSTRLAGGLIGLAQRIVRYFSVAGNTNQDAAEDAVTKALLRFGVDRSRRVVSEDGFLQGMAQNMMSSAARELFQQLLNSIAARRKKAEIERLVRDLHIKNKSQWTANVTRQNHDAAMSFNREASTEVADVIGFTHFVYAGTKEKNTRQFCEMRFNIVYTKDFAAQWENLQWKGKRPNISFFEQAGGYNCRHSLNWVSDMVAAFIASRSGFPLNGFRDLEDEE